MNFEENNDDEIIEYLIEQGVAIWDGMDSDGERIFKFDMEKLKVVMPELYEAITNDIDDTMMQLYQRGLVKVEYNENLEAIFSVGEEGKQILEQLGLIENFEQIEPSVNNMNVYSDGDIEFEFFKEDNFDSKE